MKTIETLLKEIKKNLKKGNEIYIKADWSPDEYKRDRQNKNTSNTIY